MTTNHFAVPSDNAYRLEGFYFFALCMTTSRILESGNTYSSVPVLPEAWFRLVLQWLQQLFRLLLRLVDTFCYKGIPWFTTGVALRESKRVPRGTPNIDCSRFTNSVSLLYHKEAVYRFLYRSNYKKSKNKLYGGLHVIFSWKYRCPSWKYRCTVSFDWKSYWS